MATLNNLQQVDYAKRALAAGWKYWYGTVGYKATQSLLNSKAKQYPAHYTAGRMGTYRKHIEEKRMVADCVGQIKSFFWSENGTMASKYGHGCPDKSANGLFKLCKKTGPISKIPKTPGLVVWRSGHIGISLDGEYAIEARGFNYGVVRTKIRNRNWEKWGMLPPSIMDYMDEDVPTVEPEPKPVATEGCPYAEPDRNLEKGFTGEGVKWVQWMLTHCGYSVSSCGIDGDFGKATHAAVIQFQTEHQLEADGIIGPLTRTALKAEYEKKKGA